MPDTIYLIHGMSVGAWCWRNYAPFFEARGYTCIAPDLPFHRGRADDPPDPRVAMCSLLDYASFLEHDIRTLAEPPIIIGHSMGGLLAQMLAGRGLARALVLLMPAAPAGVVTAQLSVFRSFRSIITRWGFWQEPVRQTLEEADYGVLNLCPPEERRRFHERIVYESGRAVFEMGFWFLDRRHAARVDASAVRCATLVVAGTEDRMTPAQLVRRVAHKYRHVAEYREFADHAHWALGEPGWEEIAGYVDVWLRAHVSPLRG